MRRSVAGAIAGAMALAVLGTATARAEVRIGADKITVGTPGASALITRAPFSIRFTDGSGATVLREAPAPSTPVGLTLPLPATLLGTHPVQQSALYAPLTFTVGRQLLLPFPDGPWEGDLIATGTTGVQFAARDVITARADGDGVTLTLSTSDPSGRRLVVRVAPERDAGGAIDVTARPVPSLGVATVADSFASSADERFQGFGGRHDGLDQHGQDLYEWGEEENVSGGELQAAANAIPNGGGAAYMFPSGQTAAYYPQPLFVSSRPYGFLLDQPEFARFRLDSDRPDAWQVEAGAGRLRYVVAPGPPRAAIRTLTQITGRQRVPPAWGLGPMLDRLVPTQAPTSQTPYFDEVQADIANIDRYGLPLTAYRVEGWDTITGAQDAQLFGELRARGIHPLVYFRAYVGKHLTTTHGGELLGYAIAHRYVATTAAGTPYLFADPEEGLAAVIDFSNPAAVSWWGKRIAAALELGADGFMQDFGEQVLPGMRFADGESGLQMHNRYPVLYGRATRRALDAYEHSHPGRSLFFFTRAGYTGRPGTAAYENANFPGDETTDWSVSSGLASIIPDMLNRAIGGAYGYGTDIGGYVDIHTPATTKELFLRWAQAAALMPVFRLHGSVGAGTHTPWSFDQQTVEIYNGLSRLHLAAAPLLLALWRQADRTGVPPTRPLWLEYPADPEAARQSEEWMLGDDVLVAPVVEQGATARSVYFPAGCWRAPDTGETHTGPGSATVAAPLTRLPYFFRCGTAPFTPPAAA